MSAGIGKAPESFRTKTQILDIAAIEQLVRASGVFNDSEIAIARELIEENLAKGEAASGYRFIIADGPHGIEGYTCYGPIPGTDGRFEVYWIVVSRNARGGGLASHLMTATEDAVRSSGGVWLFAETSTREDYTPARRFYVSKGYRQLAEIPEWHADGDGLAVYGKRLK
jgi:ribosomal protein S18 acetylase RimI-like enzyme